MTSPPSPRFPDLHPPRPCVYLDQWVWIRLARAANGEPREDSDPQVLAAVQDAAENGVAFPLSTTHHIETSQITNPRSRLDVARTMASISHCRTLRARKVLLRHQMLHAMHKAPPQTQEASAIRRLSCSLGLTSRRRSSWPLMSLVPIAATS